MRLEMYSGWTDTHCVSTKMWDNVRAHLKCGSWKLDRKFAKRATAYVVSVDNPLDVAVAEKAILKLHSMRDGSPITVRGWSLGST